MNKVELIAAMAEAEDTTKKAAGEHLDTLIKIISDTLSNGDDVKISGFGTFSVTERAERTGRNPMTGDVITIAASKAPKFKASKTLKDIVNE